MIVILALIAAFLALRLYSVLGRRTGHEQQPAPTQPDERVSSKIVQPQMAQPSAPERAHLANIFIAPEAENGIRAIIAADRNFDVALQMVFTDKEAHDTYQVSESHQQFIAENKSNWKQVRIFDAYVDH